MTQEPVELDVIYFVIQRTDSEWSPASKILGVYPSADEAEEVAVANKVQHPHQFFAVAMLHSEARAVRHPVEVIYAS